MAKQLTQEGLFNRGGPRGGTTSTARRSSASCRVYHESFSLWTVPYIATIGRSKYLSHSLLSPCTSNTRFLGRVPLQGGISVWANQNAPDRRGSLTAEQRRTGALHRAVWPNAKYGFFTSILDRTKR